MRRIGRRSCARGGIARFGGGVWRSMGARWSRAIRREIGGVPVQGCVDVKTASKNPAECGWITVGGHPVAVVRIAAGLHLIDEVGHGEGVVLCGAEHQGFFVLVELIHEQLHAVRLAGLDLDDPVEIGFGVAPMRSKLGRIV
jgi:hypothetical protein